ncbi:MAG: spiro-SPASM protein [Sediminispirochaetaceae bacterium]
METVAVIYAVGISDYALYETLGSGTTACARVISIARALPNVRRGVLITDREPELCASLWPEDFGPVVPGTPGSVSDVLETIRRESEGADHLFFIWGDTPLIDPELADRMFRRHVKYFASYTFADGYPQGVAPEILGTGCLGQLSELAGRHDVDQGRTMLFDVIQKDINAFDLETEVSPRDLRLHRVVLAADTRRNYLLLGRVMEKGGVDAESIVRVVEEHQEVLRTLPAYMQVQITEGCPQSCMYCPYPQIAGATKAGKEAGGEDVTQLTGSMKLETWKTLLADAHSYCDDLVVGIGLWGEPALHDDIAEMVKAALSYPKFRVVIETSGVGWSVEDLRSISRLDTDRVDWIVSLDAATPETYKKIRGPQWDEVWSAIQMMRELYPVSRLHIQAVRMHENEEELEQFYRYWKNEEVPLIIQKYDNFCGMLPDKKVTDLSPLTRFACRHLKRDLAVLMDGSVRMCREDVKGEYPLGNIIEEGMETVWERMTPFYLRHIKGDLPSLCERCDEYYTFNF